MEAEKIPVGYELPVYRAATERLLMCGVPKELAILNGVLGAVFLIALNTPWVLPVNLILHILIAAATKHDPDFFVCLKRHLKAKNYYHI